ncbi:L,D-transpeptidase [Chamaesiphon minutus]|uniref:L,D-TPase catalytic domain-containing protein n=1 Tax=Chamaesiphon minutus (strain ATCC 27169 / PCC 6605) TaxID=1173020 RepID=K9UG81_CHAP6|nr:L,D-transpeptidase [Chamaesiphon minutus]AFY94127.1 hypothetical protein Cha6605_3105 [Chamaesiphon minutus PCC 6605]
MKISTINWLSRAIVLPLFIVTASIAPASAEQMARRRSLSLGESRRVESLPSVKDLNLSIPVPAMSIDSTKSQESMSTTPYWSNSRSRNGSTTIVKERDRKSKPISKAKRKLATNRVEPINLVIPTASPPKSVLKRNKILALNTELSQNKTARDIRQTKSNFRRKLAAVSRLSENGNYLKLVRYLSLGTNEVGNPIYVLEAYVNGRKYRTFKVVTGTANTQSADRHIGNNSAPLPDGIYEVSSQVIPGMTPEVGATFIGIFPKFETKRTGLGMHLDPSFNKRNGYDGTSGCIGITTLVERDALDNFVTKYHPRSLFVSILTPSDR